MIVKLLLLVALALSLGDVHSGTQPMDVVGDIVVIDAESVEASESAVHTEVDAPARENQPARSMTADRSGPLRSRDAGRVFRPPRIAIV